MSLEPCVGAGLCADQDVVLGYPPARPVTEELVLGRKARLRSGTVLYRGSSIGERFETGHHVVVREQCHIGDDVAVWTGSVIDYGCHIADSVKIHTNCYIAQYTEICAGAFLAPGVTIANDLYPGSSASERVMSGPWIGPGAQVGVNVTILPFVRIGAGTLVVAFTLPPDPRVSIADADTPSSSSCDRALWTAAVCAACEAEPTPR